MHRWRFRWSMLLLLAGSAAAENAVRIDPAQGSFTRFTRPFRARSVPPVSLANSPRLESLLRAGNLYLSAQDAVALAMENNLDIEVQRYGPLLAQEVLRRARAGGALRSVGVGVAAGPTSVSLTGVTVTNIGRWEPPAKASAPAAASSRNWVHPFRPSIPPSLCLRISPISPVRRATPS